MKVEHWNNVCTGSIYVDVINDVTKYICSPEELHNFINVFWQMLHETCSDFIVLVTEDKITIGNLDIDDKDYDVKYHIYYDEDYCTSVTVTRKEDNNTYNNKQEVYKLYLKGLRNGNEGYEFESQNGIRYSLYVGLTFGGLEEKSSDIIFIMFDCYNDTDFFIENEQYNYNDRLVDFMYGASFVGDSNFPEYIDYINESVIKWEKEHADIVKMIKDGKIKLYEMAGN